MASHKKVESCVWRVWPCARRIWPCAWRVWPCARRARPRAGRVPEASLANLYKSNGFLHVSVWHVPACAGMCQDVNKDVSAWAGMCQHVPACASVCQHVISTRNSGLPRAPEYGDSESVSHPSWGMCWHMPQAFPRILIKPIIFCMCQTRARAASRASSQRNPTIFVCQPCARSNSREPL